MVSETGDEISTVTVFRFASDESKLKIERQNGYQFMKV
jgi:hypothetical protein